MAKKTKYPRDIVNDIYAKKEANGTTVSDEALKLGFKLKDLPGLRTAYNRFKHQDERNGTVKKRKYVKKAKRPNVPFFDIPTETYQPPTQEETFAVLLVNRSRLREVMGELCR